MQCIQPKLDAIPTEVTLYWDKNGGSDSRQIPSREPIPLWMSPQLNWLQQMQLSADSSLVDMALGGNIVWMAYVDYIGRYDMSTHRFELYDIKKQDPFLRISDILVTRDNNLWISGIHSSSDRQYSVLMHHNIDRDSFDVIDDIDGLFQPDVDVRENIIGAGLHSVLKESLDGDVLFVLRGEIYSYNLLTNKAKVIFDRPEMYALTIESDPRGMIWFTILDDDRVWMIVPATGGLQSFELPILFSELDKGYSSHGYTLYLDSRYRLWIPSWGYLDTSKKDFSWQFLVPSPMFVSLYDPEHDFIWDAAKTFESQNGSIWFTSNNGIIYYDLEKGDACWISPKPGPVIEMSDGTLLMLLENQLYEYTP
jgi:hypothetical protein